MAIWVRAGMADVRSLTEKPDLQQQISAVRTIKDHITCVALYEAPETLYRSPATGSPVQLC